MRGVRPYVLCWARSLTPMNRAPAVRLRGVCKLVWGALSAATSTRALDVTGSRGAPTLPLPSYARVTNVRRPSVVVRGTTAAFLAAAVIDLAIPPPIASVSSRRHRHGGCVSINSGRMCVGKHVRGRRAGARPRACDHPPLLQ